MSGDMVVPTSDGRTVRKVADWTNLTYAVVDVEGNGQQPPDLVELGAVPVADGVIGEPMSWLVRPGTPIRFFATRIHGLTDQDVADCPSFESVRIDVLAALAHPALIAHNAHVDMDVLRRKLPGWEPPEVFDTLKLARRLIPGQPSYKLGALTEAFNLAQGLPGNINPHRAAYDALVAARLFVLLASKAGSLEALRGHEPGESRDEPPALF
jgi:exodeoxyribonuclease X